MNYEIWESSPQISISQLNLYRVYTDLGVTRGMTVRFAITLAALFVKHDHFFATYVAGNRSLDRCIATNRNLIIVGHRQMDFVELHNLSGLSTRHVGDPKCLRCAVDLELLA